MSDYSTYSFHYWIPFLKNTIIIVYISILLITDFHKFRLFVLVMVLSLGAEATKQGWVYLIVSPGWENPNKIAFLGDNNVVAVAMLALLPCIGFLAQTTKQRWQLCLYWIMFIGVLYRALSTYSRGGFLACIGLGMAYLIRSRQKMRVLLAMLIVIAIVLPALPDAFWERMHTITPEQQDENEKSVNGRLHFWAVAIKMAYDNPWFGVGYDAYNPSYNTYDFSHGYFGGARSVHSSFFAVIAELGFLGAALYTLVLISAFHSCYRVTKLSERNPALTDFGKAALALERGLIAFLIGGCFIPIAYNEMVWHYIGLTMVLERLATQHIAKTRARELSHTFMQPETMTSFKGEGS
jgi:putative inorganic carbon (HCO3(-)) transporter